MKIFFLHDLSTIVNDMCLVVNKISVGGEVMNRKRKTKIKPTVLCLISVVSMVVSIACFAFNLYFYMN